MLRRSPARYAQIPPATNNAVAEVKLAEAEKHMSDHSTYAPSNLRHLRP